MADINRRGFITLLGGAAASSLLWPLATHAQQPRSRRFRIGWLTFGGPTLGVLERTLRDAISERGLIEGRNIEVTFRHANGVSTALSGLAGELVAQRPDLLIGLGGDVAKALFDASKGGIPIVGGVSEDPVRAEIAVSLGRPGKNFTGATFISDELAAKRIELLHEVAPAARRVAVIWSSQHLDDELRFARRAAETLGIGLSSRPVITMADVDAELRNASAENTDGLFVIPSRLTGLAAAKLARHGLDHRLPVIAAWREFVESGCLLSYGPNRVFQMRRVAEYVEKILAGAKPEDLPIERPTKFDLVVNLKTARAIGVTVPPTLLGTADEVIE
jgi:putative tryptophan/tyrosine transport system substrate-binding protein